MYQKKPLEAYGISSLMAKTIPQRPPRRLVRSDELRERIPIAQRTLGRHRAMGIIPYVKIGRVILYDVEKVVKALERFEHKAR